MPTEYRQIPKAPLYEISKAGDIQKISNQSTILPYPLKSNNVKLLVDGERKAFLVDELVKEVWDNVVIKKEEKKTEENKIEIESKNIHFGPSAITQVADFFESEEKEKKTIKTPIPTNTTQAKADNKLVYDIMTINCKMSIKIWKLHEAGLKEDEIKKIVKHPYSVSVRDTIERYKNKPSLRERADLVVV